MGVHNTTKLKDFVPVYSRIYALGKLMERGRSPEFIVRNHIDKITLNFVFFYIIVLFELSLNSITY